MTQSFFIPTAFPGLNEMIAAAKSGRGKGNAYSRQKALFTTVVAQYAASCELVPMAGKVDVSIEWHEPSARRDSDNVAAGIKFILDGLVEAKILSGDSQRYVGRMTHEVTAMKFCQPGAKVTLVTRDTL